jgi:hypothetical protein
VSLGKERKEIKLKTQIPYEGPVHIYLESIPGEVLQTSIIEIEGSGKIEDGELKIENYQFKRGTRLVDGNYFIDIKGEKELGPLDKISGNVSSIHLKAKKYMGFLSKSAFQRNLRKLKRSITRNESLYWEELQQKYLTVRMITTNIKKEVEKVFMGTDVWDKRVQNFEVNYKKNYGSFFTSFVIANEESYRPLKRKQFSDKNAVISTYSKLTRLSKYIGTSTMEVLHNLENSDGSNAEELKQKSLLRFEQIISELDSSLKKIKK